MQKRTNIFSILILICAIGSAVAQTRDVTTGRATLLTTTETKVPSTATASGTPGSTYHAEEATRGIRLNDAPGPPFAGSDPTLAHEVFEDFLNGTGSTP